MYIPPAGSIVDRLWAALPPWYGENPTSVLTVLQAYAETAQTTYNNITYAQQQTRAQTATGNNLDLISQDYFGNALPREAGENDDNFRTRILAFMRLERQTRTAIYDGLLQLTGYPPIIFEAFNWQDCAAYNEPTTGGYGVAGAYGSASYPYQIFIVVYATLGDGNAPFGGYNTDLAAYGIYGGDANGAYGGASLIIDPITDSQILAFIDYVKAAGIVANVTIIRV